jgi:hypothetical protein
VHTVNWRRFGLAVLLLAALPLSGELTSLALLAVVTLLLGLLIVVETVGYGERRARARYEFDHGGS